MWVASYIQAIQVTEESRRVSQVIINVPTSYLPQRDGGRRQAAIIETRVDVREACISREEVSVARPKGHSALGSGQPIKSLSHMPLVCKGVIRPAVRKLASTQGRDPRTHVVPNSCKGAIESSIMIRGLTTHSSNVRHAAVAAEATRELGEGDRINVRVRRVRCQHSQASAHDGRVKVSKSVTTEARSDSTQEVTQARPDAKADQQITFIRRIAVRGGGVRAKEKAVKDGDQPQGTRSGLSHRALNKSVSANRGAKDGVARGHSGSVATEKGLSTGLVRGEPRIT